MKNPSFSQCLSHLEAGGGLVLDGKAVKDLIKHLSE